MVDNGTKGEIKSRESVLRGAGGKSMHQGRGTARCIQRLSKIVCCKPKEYTQLFHNLMMFEEAIKDSANIN